MDHSIPLLPIPSPLSVSSLFVSAVAIIYCKSPGVTLTINKDAEGHRIPAMPKTLFEEWAVQECMDSVVQAALNCTMHLDSFVRVHKIFNAPLKPCAVAQDLEVSFANFRPYVVDPDYIGDNVGFNKILQRLVVMAKSDAMKERYLVVNVDQNIYARAVKVSFQGGFTLSTSSS